MQVRYAHTDIQVPDFSAYRRSPTLDPTHKNDDSAPSRKSFTYLVVGGDCFQSLASCYSYSYIYYKKYISVAKNCTFRIEYSFLPPALLSVSRTYNKN